MTQRLSDRQLSKTWLRGFKARHPKLALSRAAGLDPKRAHAFNRATVENYFKALQDILIQYGIKWRNVYMDEKSIQLGGGSKGRRRKYFFDRRLRAKFRVRMRSANLQLVTIIECVCADGSAAPPGFVFGGHGSFCPEWFEGLEDHDY